MESRVHFWQNRPCQNVFNIFNPFSRNVIRSTPAPQPMPHIHIHKMTLEPERIRPSIHSARVLAKFWKTWYKTTEWAFSMEDHELLEWIHRKGCTVLGILGPDKQLLGTVMSSPLEGTLYVGGKHVDIPLFQIDCLVLHPQIRGRGAAGWLLAWLDFSTSQHGPVAHCWKR